VTREAMPDRRQPNNQVRPRRRRRSVVDRRNDIRSRGDGDRNGQRMVSYLVSYFDRDYGRSALYARKTS
jgi:hypothetical protein